jgi:adenylate cyclase
LERRLAAILAADVVGYTRLMGEDEAGTLRRLTELREQVLEPLIAEHHGRVVKLMGDGLLVEFASVVGALTCAVAWQNGVAEREVETDQDRRLQFRIGINLGDVIVEGEDIHGDGVNIAARLEGLAEPGGICLSGDVFRQAKGKMEAEFEDMGEQVLKNVAEPVQVYRITATPSGNGAASPARKPLPVPEKPSVVVLPFANLSGDPDQDYFADGLTEDVVAQLARFRSLFVIGSTSSFAYKDQTPKVQDVGRELGVAYVIQGSVRKTGKRVRITVELVEAETGRQLWADRYDRDLADIFAVQDEVAGKVVATLAGQIEDTGRRRAAGKHTSDLAAYELVLLGEHSEKEITKDGVLRARALFQQAIERDPENARAHASMARSYLDELWSDWSADWDAAAAQAFDWAQKAVVLDGLDNRARVNLGVAHYHCKGNFEAAQGQFAKALELNPNDADAFCLRGRCHVYAGEGDEAIACTDRSMRLTPFDSNDCNMGQFLAHYTARRYAEALVSLGRIVDPAYPIDAFRAACCAQLGRDAEARNAMDAYMATAREEIAIWPGDDPKAWQRHWAQSQPFRDPADLEHLLDGFRKAGMPV